MCGPFVGPPTSTLLPGLIPSDGSEKETSIQALKELTLDTEGIYTMVSQPEYLIVAKVILYNFLDKLTSCISANWWFCRYGMIHQKVADEQSLIIYNNILKCLNKLEETCPLLNTETHRDTAALFYLEAGHCHLHYFDVGRASHYFGKAIKTLALEVEFTGALGTRTKWQQHQVAQLVLKVAYSGRPIAQVESRGPPLLPSDLPKDVILSDDTRLNQIRFAEVDQEVIPNLSSLEQMALFAQLLLMRKSQAQDETFNEETKAYLSAILQHPKSWSLQLSALVIRSRIESGEFRAMERSLNQLEELVKAVQREEPSRFERLKLIYASSLITQWNLQQELARMFMRLGCTKTALEIFERLNLWEDVIVCYNELQMRQRAAEVIQQLLDKEETPKLWCLMGDATDDVECYWKAWEISGRRSGRAQRCLGNFYYVRHDYQSAIEYFEKSVEINSLQFPVWQRLAYCALQTEAWEKCAAAYKRCSILEPDNFDCWNNLSQAYLKLGKTYQAWKTLQEALRCKMDNWRLWDNYMLVSASLGYMIQALNAYNRILQYKEKHVDTEILGRIVQAVLNEKLDPEGKPLKNLHKKCIELLGKLAREVPTQGELWFLYAELVFADPERCRETKHTAMQYYRKAVAADTQKPGWEKAAPVANLAIMRALKLVEVAKEVCEESHPKAALSDLSSIRMLLRSLVTLIRKNQEDVTTGHVTEKLRQPLEQLEHELGTIDNLIERFRST